MFRITGMGGFFGRMYLQFIIIIFIAFFLAIILNSAFIIDDHELRIMLTSILLACFTGAILVIRKI